MLAFRTPLAGALLLLSGGLAVADDLSGLKDDPWTAPFNWSGLYIGGHAGIASGNMQGEVVDEPELNADVGMNGALYGIHAGYNHQMGSTVIGIEGSYSGSTLHGSTTCVLFLTCSSDIDGLATIAGRLGYAMDKSLVYVKGGVAWADVSVDVDILGFPLVNSSESHTGWVAGIGFEHAISESVSARVEYQHVNLNTVEHSLEPAGIPADVEATINSVNVGVSIKF